MSSRDTTILLGTTKGAFLATGGGDDWRVKGPLCNGWPINHVIADAGILWAGGGGEWYGAGVWRSDDGGETWEVSRITKGTIDEWAANDADFAAMMNWTDEPPPFTDEFAQV